MQTRKRHPVIGLITFFLFFIILTVHYTGAIDISIKNAVPLIILPLLTAFSMFNPVVPSAIAGLLTGIFMDSTATGSICFNAIVIMLCAVFISALSENMFNRNIRSALLLSLLTSLVYYLLRWALFYAFTAGVHNNLTYILSYIIPSVLYTNVFIFPFYFLYKYFNKCINS